MYLRQESQAKRGIHKLIQRVIGALVGLADLIFLLQGF